MRRDIQVPEQAVALIIRRNALTDDCDNSL
ncbi:hypothetical protein K788_00024010 [Paraburkholderia caribensis MBA4]|uniref:Uncharacterized protein n=1 Tax=Paraburkholderia caribensis MBA4 TaxID=1323664 RepID=A0A0P0RK21_9BURK|nr:hypothetical protein K788_00024010 [Paraburkholderia caribensis MBA4]